MDGQNRSSRGGEQGIARRHRTAHGAFEHVQLRQCPGLDGNQAGDLTNRYLWAGAVDQILADEAVTNLTSAGDVLWPLADNLGTVRDLAEYDDVGDTTSVVNHITYDAFGNVTSETAAAVDHLFGYTGRAFDDETGLQNNLHRWFDPVTGRWASEDPIGFAAGDANLYRYVGNFSTGAIDPRGELWWLLIIPLAGTIAL
ncbi:MAG: RHS repeat-associated core domain-containing protein, partial [Planctomycetota bacterium]